MNQITVAGHLGADPEVRFTSSGQKVTSMRVAARVRKGSKGDDTIWWRITIWGEQFDKMIPHFKKGSPIIVFGELNKPEIFTDREGRSQVSMNITAQNLLFSPFGRPDSQAQSHSEEQEPSNQEMAFSGGGEGQREFGQGKEEQNQEQKPSDDEIPF
ncbi:MAG: Single-stranded DNA-binding protein [Chlamydiae bacterium]|nr:Single-stranded DNA-binding protein [Chlamydiota bacterium]